MKTLKRWIVRLLMILMVAVPVGAVSLYVINPHGARSYDPRHRIIGYGPYRVPSRSMAPTVNPDQILLVKAGAYNRHEPQRGDIVVFISPVDGNHWLKRVIGLPGETIVIEDGAMLIDGNTLHEGYLSAENTVSDYSRQMPAHHVPENSYFLLGDNRDNSEDARIFGAIHRDDLVGKVVAIF